MALPSLTTKNTREIEALIRSWSTKLTWALLVDRIKVELDITTTRQTLVTYKSIKETFDNKKLELRGKSVSDDLVKDLVKFTQADIDRYEQVNRLEAKISLLEEKVTKQLAFIKQLSELADTNPALIELLNKVKQSLSKRG
ncbi:hypothetical protein [Vibrio diazotrophicus]|uniref:hypothetical protein n=1 Tax=Vibrio diazotrophicus TaxID=685 RepID=UPI000C9E9EBE|nr:hypothetical protein [Vibrio diazotrophicus]PNH90522.1 hypothetical protein C1M59_16415 [Vibrio diazotrophicus]